MAKKKPGPKTELTDKLFKEIRDLVHSGKNFVEIAKATGIDVQKLYNWRSDNFLGFDNRVRTWQLEAKLNKAERRSEEILSMPTRGDDGKVDTGLTSIIQRESQFVRETLGKQIYSKKVEQDITSKGEAITGINYIKPDGDNTKTTSEAG